MLERRVHTMILVLLSQFSVPAQFLVIMSDAAVVNNSEFASIAGHLYVNNLHFLSSLEFLNTQDGSKNVLFCLMWLVLFNRSLHFSHNCPSNASL